MSCKHISIHAPLRERPEYPIINTPEPQISIHAPLRERHFGSSSRSVYSLFQSTLPYGSDVDPSKVNLDNYQFQSTLPYGSDPFVQQNNAMAIRISIHAPLRERQPLATLLLMSMQFQSTLPYGSDHRRSES